MVESRSKRQLSAYFTMIASSAVMSFAAPSNSLFANARVLSAAFALFQNFTSSLLKSCWLMSHWNSICIANRSEEHTSELQSRLHLVCRLLLEKKKKKK